VQVRTVARCEVKKNNGLAIHKGGAYGRDWKSAGKRTAQSAMRESTGCVGGVWGAGGETWRSKEEESGNREKGFCLPFLTGSKADCSDLTPKKVNNEVRSERGEEGSKSKWRRDRRRG